MSSYGLPRDSDWLREIVGGAAVTEESTPEFRASRFSEGISLLHSPVIYVLDPLRLASCEIDPPHCSPTPPASCA